MDPNLALLLTTVLVSVVGIVVPVLTLIIKYKQDNRIARNVSVKMEGVRQQAEFTQANYVATQASAAVVAEEARLAVVENQQRVDAKLDSIHVLVNDQLTQAVNRFRDALIVIEELKTILVKLAPNDPRVKSVVAK